jgi:hypothetical protein
VKNRKAFKSVKSHCIHSMVSIVSILQQCKKQLYVIDNCVWISIFWSNYRKNHFLLYLNHNPCVLFDTVRIWEFSPVWADFDKCHNLSKRNVKLILKIVRDLEPLRGSSNKKTLYSTRSCVNWAFLALVVEAEVEFLSYWLIIFHY